MDEAAILAALQVALDYQSPGKLLDAGAALADVRTAIEASERYERERKEAIAAVRRERGRLAKAGSPVEGRGRQGRPRRSDLRVLVGNLARVYYQLTGREPGYSRSGSKPQDGRSPPPRGPFLDFVRASVRGCTNEGVAGTLDAIKDDYRVKAGKPDLSPDWRDHLAMKVWVNLDGSSATEVFGAALYKQDLIT